MTLNVGNPPADLTDGVRDVLRRKAEKKQFRTPSLVGMRPEELAIGTPHGIYTLTTQDLIARRGLEAAEFVGWRYFVQRGADAIAAVEIPARVDGDIERMMHVNEGQFVGATFQAVAAAETMDEIQGSGYELRLLKILPLYTVALWLRPDEGDQDILIPIGQCHPAVEPGRVYRPEEFIGALAEPAEELAKVDTRPRDKTT